MAASMMFTAHMKKPAIYRSSSRDAFSKFSSILSALCPYQPLRTLIVNKGIGIGAGWTQRRVFQETLSVVVEY